MVHSEVRNVVVTLYEGRYHFGVATLINSLINAHFKGIIRVGYKGNLPAWTSQLVREKDDEFVINDDLHIIFVHTSPEMHFGYFKPQFMKDTLELLPTIERVFYFDPDIVVNAPWTYFDKWVDAGIALCLDNCFPYVHENHPWRMDWIDLAQPSRKNECTFYVNSGFCGIKRSDSILLDRWISITHAYQLIGGNVRLFEKDAHRSFKGDQDLLNAAITGSPDLRFSVIGKEGMGFSQPAYLMSHAVGDVKPWNKNYLIYLLKRGESPHFTDKDYLKFVNNPIKSIGDVDFRLKKLNMKVASILGRVLS